MKNKEIEKSFMTETILKSYFRKDPRIVKCEDIEAAINGFIKYFRLYDSENKTNHLAMIIKIFDTQELNYNTAEKFDMSTSTYLENKKIYLNTFETFLKNVL